MDIVLTLLCALLLGLCLMKAKIPGGMMIGAVAGACAFGLITGRAMAPAPIKTIAQILAGAMIGSGISREEAKRMKLVIKPALIQLPMLLLVNLLAGFLIFKTGTMDALTALMATTPGGISNIPMIAADMGADASKVTVLQFVRFFMGIALFPAVINLIEGKPEKNASAVKEPLDKPVKPAKNPWMALLAFAAAGACGLLGWMSPMPSGTMAFSTLGTIALKCALPPVWTPKYTGKAAQWLSGAYVGALMGPEQLKELLLLPLPILIILICYTIGAWLISVLLLKAGCFSRKESMLAATPAGATDMALISADMGIHNVKLVLIQVIRLIVVVTLFPTILSLAAKLMG